MLLRVLVVLVLVVALAANLHLIRSVSRGDREHLRRFLQQWGASLLYAGGGLRAVVRTIVPVSLLVTWFLLGTATVALLQDETPGPVLIAYVLGIPVLGINFLVVRYTGWPAFQVPAPFRGMSEADLQAWWGTDSAPASARAITDHLPLDVVDASWDGSVLVVRGQDWYLAVWSPWRGHVEGRQVDRDDEGTRDLVRLLGGQQLVAVHGQGPRGRVTVFELTQGRIEVEPEPRGRPWQLRLPGRTVVNTARA